MLFECSNFNINLQIIPRYIESKTSKLEKFERFENGFLNISIQNYSALYRSKISNVEKLYFDSHGIGEIERIGEYSNFNISLQIIPRYIESIEN